MNREQSRGDVRLSYSPGGWQKRWDRRSSRERESDFSLTNDKISVQTVHDLLACIKYNTKMILEFKTTSIMPKAAKIAERREALAQADHELRIEGLRSSDFAAPLFEALARGEITADELRDQLTLHYRSDLG